jgi:WhiB family redox-sensing transcriptional regulator
MRELFLLPEPSGWHQRALCATADPMEFMSGADGNAPVMCLRCPVMRECGDEATANDERVGVWGGLDRRRLN